MHEVTYTLYPTHLTMFSLFSTPSPPSHTPPNMYCPLCPIRQHRLQCQPYAYLCTYIILWIDTMRRRFLHTARAHAWMTQSSTTTRGGLLFIYIRNLPLPRVAVLCLTHRNPRNRFVQRLPQVYIFPPCFFLLFVLQDKYYF